MLIKDIDKYNSIYGKVDAFIIVNKDNVIQYSAMVDDDGSYLNTKNVMGKDLFETYPNLTEENCTHSRVMRTGKPVINENQLIVEQSGKAYVICTSTFPIENNGELIGTIDISSNLTLKSKKRGQEDERSKLYTVDSITTKNQAMIEIKDKILKISKNDSPVMVIGESGVGKELVVEAIHTASNRCNKPFISLNCAAIPDSLMESILFGTVKGSFTGAENRKGIFEIANGGTLFLDEINSMNIELQAKLLKAVEEQKYMKIGGEKYIDVDVRVLSAMNVNPEDAIRTEKLRQDLFFRLGVIQLNIPPLRKRKEDISILVDSFLHFYNCKMNKKIKAVDDEVIKAFMDYSWPGNIRELRNVIESSFNMTDDNRIGITDIPEYLIAYSQVNDGMERQKTAKGLTEIVGEYEKDILIKTLNECHSLSEASRILKMTRQAIKYKIEKYDLEYKELLKR